LNKFDRIDGEELEFTTLDLLGSLKFFRPFKWLFKKTRYLKNPKNYLKYKTLIEEEVQIYRVVLNSVKLTELENKFCELDASLRVFTNEIEKMNDKVCNRFSLNNMEVDSDNSDDRVNMDFERNMSYKGMKSIKFD